MTYPISQLPMLPPNTIVPDENKLFVPYFNRVYEDIAFAVNAKDNSYFPIAISSTASNIPNIPNYGAFIVCISGVDSSLPALTASLCKASEAAAGSVTTLGSQAGTGAWLGKTLTITAAAANFQVAHNNVGAEVNFNIKIIGTQG